MNKTLNFPTTNISPVRSSDSLLSPNEEGLISLAAHYFVTGAKNNNTQLIEKGHEILDAFALEMFTLNDLLDIVNR